MRQPLRRHWLHQEVPGHVDQTIIYTATVTTQYGGAATGTVTFGDGGATIATVAHGKCCGLCHVLHSGRHTLDHRNILRRWQ